MSGYVLGLITVPVVVLATWWLWVCLALVVRVLPIVSRALARRPTNGQRNGIAGLAGSAIRSWRVTFGQFGLIFIAGYDLDEGNEAKRVLDHDGPWATYVSTPTKEPS